MSRPLTVGVLAVQGAFAEHCAALRRAGAKPREIREARSLEGLDAVILPGGESTAQGRLMREFGIFEPLRAAIAGGLPVFGTCAGMILLAKNIENDERRHLAVMDIAVRRNGYGRQLASFVARGAFAGMEDVEMVFIRAPYIASAGPNVEILAETGGRAVAAREGNMLAAAFHPEMTDDPRVLEYFLSMARG
ncbi:pyridoxal 5'-phosphate synthase glutaminase subunit PdxT [Cloacibacillus sp. An23]|uniref:pyridoxal 5'-phosphate synthase glutaminase subunit PdxT n=1 Tax=Cloacibacillus sp. An23 TaxID=1965591 RepID=UPI000B3A6FE0|nr:pyridoxal 5'-phosphate synthase glutaminase subunit PdxT [Cloacibacillus sp. An23]OUO94029.1 pyridoxal 5'-phosphate synthase glutaminase subunit PdxT [Cloacibacillus sp. An23]